MSGRLDSIVATLTAARARQGLSMRAVAAAADISTSCVHSWEHGVRQPNLQNLRRWADVLGYDLHLTERPRAHSLTNCSCGQPHRREDFL